MATGACRGRSVAARSSGTAIDMAPAVVVRSATAGSKRAYRVIAVVVLVTELVATPLTTGTAVPTGCVPLLKNCTVPVSVGSDSFAVSVNGWPVRVTPAPETLRAIAGRLIGLTSGAGEPAGAIVTGISSVQLVAYPAE